MTKEQQRTLEIAMAQYMPHGIKAVLTADFTEEFAMLCEDIDLDDSIFSEGSIWNISSYVNPEIYVPLGDGNIDGFLFSRNDSTYACFGSNGGWKPLLRPLSDLVKRIVHNSESFIPAIKLFGENDEFSIEIGVTWESMAKDFAEQKLTDICVPLSFYDSLNEWKFDYRDLISQSLAISIHDLPENPYL